MPHFLSSLFRDPKLKLVNQRTGDVLATDILTAFDSASRRKGLLTLNEMPPGGAMIIAPCGAVHTIGMRFPIDVIFASKSGRVVKVRQAVRPWRFAGSLKAFAAIEFAAGRLRNADVQPGDTLILVQ